MKRLALLALEDGSLFYGDALGIDGECVGEVVFNTAMTGYQEILTDPSYARQIITLTYPHIGNVGANPEDEESSQIFASGLVIRNYPVRYSSWRAKENLGDYLSRHDVVAIASVDTRRLTRILRRHGAQNACLQTGNIDSERAVAEARAFVGLKGMDLAREVTTRQAYEWVVGGFSLGEGFSHPDSASLPLHVVAYDFGIKRNILRMLVDRGCRITVVPATTLASKVFEMKPDGVFLSNGPGDPEPCDYAIIAIQAFLQQGMPLFGICLGHQLLGLATGARTTKMKFGHHGANHPVQDIDTGQVMITSQNHGFAVDKESLPPRLRPTHRSLFDGSLQGIECLDAPAFSFQGHPEASPGPHDVSPLFDRFIDLMRTHVLTK